MNLYSIVKRIGINIIIAILILILSLLYLTIIQETRVSVECNFVIPEELSESFGPKEGKENFPEREKGQTRDTGSFKKESAGACSNLTIFTDLNPLYLTNVKDIKFINYNGEYYGKTTESGSIELNLTGELTADKVLLCHELIHTIFWSDNETFDELLAEDLSYKLVCYY